MIRETLAAAALSLWLHFKPPSPPTRKPYRSDAQRLEEFFAELVGDPYVIDPGPSLVQVNPHEALAKDYPL